MTTWTKLEDGTWGIRWEDCPYPGGTAEGLPVTVTTRAGKKTEVIAGPRERYFLVKGGRRVDIYRVATPEQEARYTREYAEQRERALND